MLAADLDWLAHGAGVLLWLLVGELREESVAGCLHVEAWLVQPGVLSDLADGWALVAVEGEQSHDEVLELT